MICWTSIAREDRWFNGKWQCFGSVYLENMYDSNFIKKFADPVGYAIRDFASIHLITEFLKLKKCQTHMFSIFDFTRLISEWDIDKKFNKNFEKIKNFYSKDLDFIKNNYYSVLWNDDIILNKTKKEINKFGENASDSHPNPLEHLSFLRKIFNHNFNKDTIDTVEKTTTDIEKFRHKVNKPLWEVDKNIIENFIKFSKIKESLPVERFNL